MLQCENRGLDKIRRPHRVQKACTSVNISYGPPVKACKKLSIIFGATIIFSFLCS